MMMMLSLAESSVSGLVAMAAHLISVTVNKVSRQNHAGVRPCDRPGHYKCNSAIRLCYSLQLLPVVNEKHELCGVPDQPRYSQLTMPPAKRSGGGASSSSSAAANSHHQHGHDNHQLLQQHQQQHHHQPPRADEVETAGQGWSILWVPLIFGVSTAILFLLSRGFIDDQTHESQDLKFPTSMEELSELARFLSHCKENHWRRVLTLFVAGYVYKQTFAIPGSVFLNVLSGALFGPWHGFALTALLSAVGATNCYLLSKTFGRAYVTRWFPDKVHLFQKKTEENRDSLFFFLLSLRLFPMSPNWLMNIVAPIVGIPIQLFFLSVFIGLMPYTFVCAQTGSVLSQVSSVGDIFSTWTMLTMLLAALVALLPALAIKMTHAKDS